MNEFRKLCEAFEQMDPETFGEIISVKSKSIIGALSALTHSGVDGVTAYLNFILCAIAADGKLAQEEYELLQPLLETLLDKPVSYQDAKVIFSAAGLDRPQGYKDAVDAMVDLLGLVSVELKADIIMVCMMICGIDGKISRKEKKWIKQLMA